MYKNSPILRWRKYNEQYLLIGNRCKNCEAVYYPKKYLCDCAEEKTSQNSSIINHISNPLLSELPDKKNFAKQNSFIDFQLSGKGTILSYTEIRSAPEEYKDQVPYCFAIIQLTEGPKMIAQITDCSITELKIGMPVKAVLRRFYKINEEGIIHYGIKFKLNNIIQNNIIFTNEVSKD